MRDPRRLPPFTDRRRLPSAFPAVLPIPPAVKELAVSLANEHGDDPGNVLTDLLALMADELGGAVFDERELGFATTPPDDPDCGREPKPEPGRPSAPPTAPVPGTPAPGGPLPSAPASPGGIGGAP